MGLLVGTETCVSLGDICPSCKVLFKNGVLFLKIAPPWCFLCVYIKLVAVGHFRLNSWLFYMRWNCSESLRYWNVENLVSALTIMTVIDQGRFLLVFLHLGWLRCKHLPSYFEQANSEPFLCDEVCFILDAFIHDNWTNLVIILRYEFNKPNFIFSRPVKGNNIAKSCSICSK